MTDLTKLLGYAIRRRRQDLRLAMLKLSELSGVSYATTFDAEHGRRDVKTRTLELLAAALGCRTSDLLRDAERMRFMIASTSTRRQPRDNSDPRAYYGRALRRLRKERGIRLVDAAERGGVTAPQYCEVERAERPALRVLERCVAGIGCKVSDVVLLAEQMAEARTQAVAGKAA